VETGCPDSVSNVRGATNLHAFFVMATRMSAPRLNNSRKSSADLYTAMPPVAQSSIFLFFSISVNYLIFIAYLIFTQYPSSILTGVSYSNEAKQYQEIHHFLGVSTPILQSGHKKVIGGLKFMEDSK
jgi:hypothetical protein